MIAPYEIISGDPVYRGAPLAGRIRAIKQCTLTDKDGRRYYRRGLADGWRRLRTSDDFRLMNHAIDSQHVEEAVRQNLIDRYPHGTPVWVVNDGNDAWHILAEPK